MNRTPLEAIAQKFSLNTREQAVVADVIGSVDKNQRLTKERLRQLKHLGVGLTSALSVRFGGIGVVQLMKRAEESPLPIESGAHLAQMLGCSEWIVEQIEQDVSDFGDIA